MAWVKRRKILDYALGAIWRRRGRNGAVLVVFTFVVFLLCSILFLVQALKAEASLLLQDSPDLTVQRVWAGRHDLIPRDYADRIKTVAGVSEVRPRVWGYYYDALTEANYTVTERAGAPDRLELLAGTMPDAPDQCAVGAGVAELRSLAVGDELILIDSRNVGTTFEVSGVFSADSRMLTNDLIVMTQPGINAFFDIPEGKATDIVVTVRNPGEVDTVAKKVRRFYPDARPITRREVLRTYDAVFNWRSGMLLAAFAGAIIAFCVLAWDKATGLSMEERKEIGILKAVGWDTGDVLEMKFWEGIAVSLIALLLGLCGAYIHVFFFRAALFDPVLRGWSVLFPALHLTPRLDLYSIVQVAFFTVTPYVVSTVFPSWKAAIEDPEAVIRG